MGNKIKISVIMAVYNTKKEHLVESIKSILNQTYKAFEFIIIDDNSNYDVNSLITRFNDERIKFIQNEENKGLAGSLNIAIKKSKGEFIARMDSDDISLPRRLEMQLEFMRKNEEVVVLGTQAINIGDKNGHRNYVYDDNDKLKSQIFFNSTITHPSVMLRKNFLDINGIKYDSNFKKAQDFELWYKIIKNNGIIKQLPEVLLLYRCHPDQATKSSFNEQNIFANKVRVKFLNELNIYPNQHQMDMHFNLCTYDKIEEVELNEISKWCKKLIDNNKKVDFLENNAFKEVLFEKWFILCLKLFRSNKKIIKDLFNNDFFRESTNIKYWPVYIGRIKIFFSNKFSKIRYNNYLNIREIE